MLRAQSSHSGVSRSEIGIRGSVGRLFNALAAAYDFKQQNMPVTLRVQAPAGQEDWSTRNIQLTSYLRL